MFMTPPIGSPFSQDAVNLLAPAAGLTFGQACRASEYRDPGREGVDEDHDWDNAWIDIGGEG
jgi:hypothetical protein